MHTPQLYQKYFIDKADERRGLFQLLAQHYPIRKGLYAGSFVHIAPSFFIPDMVYVDSDRRISKFFSQPELIPYVRSQKTYDHEPKLRGIQADFHGPLDLEEGSFDLLLSMYAGFVSQGCKRFLVSGGILCCNNSHGDASLALIDPDYTLKGVVLRQGQEFTLKTEDLEQYITKKDKSPIDGARVRARMVGETFHADAFCYLFTRR